MIVDFGFLEGVYDLMGIGGEEALSRGIGRLDSLLGDCFRWAGFHWQLGRLSGQGVLGLAFGDAVGFGPGEEFAEVAVEIGRDGRSRVTDFLNDGVFHG